MSVTSENHAAFSNSPRCIAARKRTTCAANAARERKVQGQGDAGVTCLLILQIQMIPKLMCRGHEHRISQNHIIGYQSRCICGLLSSIFHLFFHLFSHFGTTSLVVSGVYDVHRQEAKEPFAPQTAMKQATNQATQATQAMSGRCFEVFLNA